MSNAIRHSERALVPLVYELLDAHDDTVQMAGELESDPTWQSHLHYLRCLKRKGREMLAAMAADDAGV